MAKEYAFVGVLPAVIPNYGRVEPGSPNFKADIEPEWEAFAIKAGVLRIVRDLAEQESLTPAPKDSATWPTSWPRTPPEQVKDSKKGGD